MSKINRFKASLQLHNQDHNFSTKFSAFSDTEESLNSFVYSPTQIAVHPDRSGRMARSIKFYDLRGIQKNKIKESFQERNIKAGHQRRTIDANILKNKITPDIESYSFSKNQFALQPEEENMFDVISSVKSVGKSPVNLIHSTPTTQALALPLKNSHEDFTFSSSVMKLRKKMNQSRLGGELSRNYLRKGLISAHTANTGNEIHSTQPSSVFNHLQSNSVTPTVKNKPFLPNLVLTTKEYTKSLLSKNEPHRHSLRNSPKNSSITSQCDFSQSKSTTQPNSRLYNRVTTRLLKIDEKNELLMSKLNKVERSHGHSQSFSTSSKVALSQEDNIRVQNALNKVIGISKKRATLKTNMQPVPIVKRKSQLIQAHSDDYHTFELSGVSFYRQENVHESRIPIEAVYNQFTDKIKTKELQRNQKHETKVVIVTPNKHVIKDYAEILVKSSNKRLSIPLNNTRRSSKVEVAQKWQKSIKKVINMMKFKSRNSRSFSPTAVEDMPGYYEAKAERKENVKRLKSRYSKFATFQDFTKQNLKALEPLELVNFEEKQGNKQVVGPLASNEFELKLQEEKVEQRKKSKFMPRKKLSLETESRRCSRINFSRWYLDGNDRGNLKSEGKNIDLDIEKEQIGPLSISELNLNKLPSSKSVIPPRIKQELMKEKEKLGTIASESQLSESSQKIPIKLRRDPFKKIQKAVSLFSANLDQQIKLQVYEEREEPVSGYDFLD